MSPVNDVARYELAAAALTDADVADAVADLAPGTATWQVTLEFTAAQLAHGSVPLVLDIESFER